MQLYYIHSRTTFFLSDQNVREIPIPTGIISYIL